LAISHPWVCIRHALVVERVHCNAVGQVVRKLKTTWRDGRSDIVMSPPNVMQHLAALLPRLRVDQRMSASRPRVQEIR